MNMEIKKYVTTKYIAQYMDGMLLQLYFYLKRSFVLLLMVAHVGSKYVANLYY